MQENVKFITKKVIHEAINGYNKEKLYERLEVLTAELGYKSLLQFPPDRAHTFTSEPFLILFISTFVGI